MPSISRGGRFGWEDRGAEAHAPARRSRGPGGAPLQLESGGRWGLQPPPSVAMEKRLEGPLQLCSCLPHTLRDKRGPEVANEQL